MRTTYMKIKLNAIRENLQAIRKIVPQNIEIIAVVKANAYGYGAYNVAQIALQEGCRSLAVAIIKEAKELREAGIKSNIYILGLLLPEEYEDAVNFDCIIPVCESTDLEKLNRLGQEKNRIIKVMVAIDSGMNRIGVKAPDVLSFLSKLKFFDKLEIVGFFTHYACADSENHSHVEKQMNIFSEMVKKIPNKERYMFTAANSPTIMYFPESYYDAVRPGQIIYGYMPNGYTDNYEQKNKLPKLNSCLSLHSRIVHIHKVFKGDTVGYGATYKCKEDTLIATIPIGYADGYPRCLSNKGEVLIDGKRYKIVGRICMDQIMVDINNSNNIKVGDEVILIGKQNEEEITIKEIADLAGTIPNEISCLLSTRIPRIYCEE